MKTIILVALLAALLIAGCTAPGQGTGGTGNTTGSGGSTQIPNPASQYCEQHGGTLQIRTGQDGGQYGVCMFSDGSECDEWAYYRGECKPQSEQGGGTEQNQTNQTEPEQNQTPPQTETIYMKIGGLPSHYTKVAEIGFFVQSENADCTTYINDVKVEDLAHFSARATQNVRVTLTKANQKNYIKAKCGRNGVFAELEDWVVWDTTKPYWQGNEVTIENTEDLVSAAWPKTTDLSPVTFHVEVTYKYYDYTQGANVNKKETFDTTETSWEAPINGVLKEVQISVTATDAAGNVADGKMFKRLELG